MIKVGDKLRLCSGRVATVAHLHKQHVLLIDSETDSAYLVLRDDLLNARVIATKWYNLYTANPGGRYFNSKEEAVKNAVGAIATLSVEIDNA